MLIRVIGSKSVKMILNIENKIDYKPLFLGIFSDIC